jgi:hypothetical protein
VESQAVTRILAKNAAFEALARADRAIEKRERAHRAGRAEPVPATWWARRQELAEAYRAACREV